tara:strand:+ start:269 stop:922 length:654 start_codon:yes stop_codon:yes gene_type:complete
MSKKKVINGKDYRWDYQKKKWVQSHGSSGGEAIAGGLRSIVGLFNRDKAKIKKKGESNNTTKVSDHKDTGHTKLVKGPDGKVRRVKVSDTTKDKTLKGSDTSKIKSKSTEKSSDSEKAAWLKKTRNSPAAKSGAFTDDERWAQQQKHRKWKSDRKAKTEAKKNKLKATQGKSMPSNPKGMRQEGVGKTAKDLTRHKTVSSITKKKKKKKQDLNFTTM